MQMRNVNSTLNLNGSFVFSYFLNKNFSSTSPSGLSPSLLAPIAKT